MAIQFSRDSRQRPEAGAIAPASGLFGRSKLLVGLAPAFLYITNLFFGANSTVAAQGMTLCLALLLLAALTLPNARRDIPRVRLLIPHMVGFALILTVAGWTLLAPASGEIEPVWAVAGLPGSLTLNRSATTLEMVKLSGLACIGVLGCLQGSRTRRARASTEALVSLGGLYAVASLVAFFGGLQVRQGGRLTGGFMSANSAATVFGMLVVITAGLLIRRWLRAGHASLQGKAVALAPQGICLLLFLVCLLLTASRMGLAATFLAFLALATWEAAATKARLASLVLAGLFAGTIIAVLIFASGGNLIDRLDNLDSDAANRGQIFAAHWDAFLRSPLLGYGLGTFTDVNNQVMTPENYAALWSIRAAHNVYIQWLEEAGIFGAIPMFCLIASVISLSALGVRHMRSCQGLARGLIASGIVVLVHGSADYALQVPSISAFWAFILGLQFALTRRRSRRRRSRKVGHPHRGASGVASGVLAPMGAPREAGPRRRTSRPPT